jgi:hypothetical protein
MASSSVIIKAVTDVRRPKTGVAVLDSTPRPSAEGRAYLPPDNTKVIAVHLPWPLMLYQAVRESA